LSEVRAPALARLGWSQFHQDKLAGKFEEMEASKKSVSWGENKEYVIKTEESAYKIKSEDEVEHQTSDSSTERQIREGSSVPPAWGNLAEGSKLHQIEAANAIDFDAMD
jgi:hypothetical protein